METIRLGKSKGVHQKHISLSGLPDDSAAYFDGNTRDHRFSLEMGQSSTRRSTLRPVVKMLAQMYKGMKPKRKSPSFIARLMGFGRSQSKSHVDRKMSSDSYPQNDLSIDIQRNRQHYDGRSDRRTSMEQQEPEDFYEDKDPSILVNRRRSSRWRTASSMLMRSDKKFDKQKFADARQVSTYEKLQVSEELDDTSDLPDSKDILAKSSRKGGSSSARNPNDLRVNTGGSHRSHEAVLKPSNSEKYGCSTKAWISERGSSSKFPSFHLERKDGLLLDPSYNHQARTSNIQFQDKKGKEMNSPRVILKQNLNAMQTSGRLGSSRKHSHGRVTNIRGINENPSARGICRRTTRQVRDVRDESSLLRGYAGDVSSFESQDSDSGSEGEMFGLSYRNSLRTSNKWCRYPSSGLVEHTKPKKRSEIWNITEKYQDLVIVSRDSTPSENLATTEEETRSMLLNSERSLGRANSKHGSIRESTMREGPTYISGKDGGKDEIRGTAVASNSSNTKGAYRDLLAGKAVVMCGNTAHSCGSEAEKGNLNYPCHHTNSIDFSAQTEFELKMEANVKNVSEQQLMCELAAKDDSSGGTSSSMVFSEHESTTTLSFKSFLLDPEQSSGADEDKAAIGNQEEICLQGPPNRPLEEGSSSQNHPMDCEGSDRLNVVFHELRMQLLLLNMNMSPDATFLFEKHIAKLSSILYEGNYTFDSEGWVVSYLIDVLIHSGLQESGFDILRLTWHSPDSPLDPTSFDDLEKIYSDYPVSSISERKLLFDRINLALFDIFLQHIDLFPWVTPGPSGLRSAWKKKESSRDALERMINQECAIGKAPERVIDRDMEWTDYRGEIDVIVIEIEMMLIDEMIDELVCDL